MNNIIINPKGTVIGKTVGLHKLYSSFFIRIATFLFWILGIFSIIAIKSDYLFGYEQSKFMLGVELIMAGLFLFYLSYRRFYFSKEMHPGIEVLSDLQTKINNGEKINLFESFSFELARTTEKSLSSNSSLSFQAILSDLSTSSEMNFILVRMGIQALELIQIAESDILDEQKKSDLFISALKIGVGMNHDQIETGDVFAAICQKSPSISMFLNNLKLSPEDIVNIVYWQTQISQRIKRRRGFFNPDNFRKTGGIGRDWAYGWTPYLKQFSTDISRSIRESGLDLEIIGHDSEIKQIEEALCRDNGGNVIIVGEAGIGKDTTVLGFAKKVSRGETHTILDFQQIVKIDTNFLLSSNGGGAEITERISGLMNEAAAAGNIIIYFENFQNLISSGDAGKVNATEVLLPFLNHSSTHIIATCDTGSYNQYIATNSSLDSRLTRITIEEPDQKEMVRILEDVVPSIEYRTKSIISYEAIKASIVASEKYIINLPNPEKSINLLDGVAAKAAADRGRTIILPKDIDEYISEKYDVPAGDADEIEKGKLLSLETEMHKSVIGQNEAILAISNAMRRTRAGIVDSKKPIGSFLFLGPTGVGKTETAKALARTYFGDESKMIRFDMSEYQNKEDIYRLIGSNLGGENDLGLLTTAIREHPFSLLLFDEIEKAHPDILNLFLQVLDEGFLTDGSGKRVSFSNSIIICTSNAGADLIRQSIQNGGQYESTKASLMNYLQEKNIFRPEFINRFTSVVAFAPLSLPEITQVANLMIARMIETIKTNKGVIVSVTPEAVTKLANMGFNPEMGARPMARIISEKLENLLASKILAGELKSGDVITITDADIV